VSQYWQFGTSIYSYFSLSVLVYPCIELILLKIIADIDEEPMVLLKMTCLSTGHIHILRVPPEMNSAEAAITWVNHGIHPDEFSVQT
jgi:leucine-rich repeat protein SHOC2